VLVEAGVAEDTVPVTYMNSTAAIKAFTGRHGGTICTSSQRRAGTGQRGWAFEQGPSSSAKVLFLPDQHLGATPPCWDLGLSLDDCVVFDPHRPRAASPPRSCAPRR
jgi:quinolinate synthase